MLLIRMANTTDKLKGSFWIKPNNQDKKKGEITPP